MSSSSQPTNSPKSPLEITDYFPTTKYPRPSPEMDRATRDLIFPIEQLRKRLFTDLESPIKEVKLDLKRSNDDNSQASSSKDVKLYLKRANDDDMQSISKDTKLYLKRVSEEEMEASSSKDLKLYLKRKLDESKENELDVEQLAAKFNKLFFNTELEKFLSQNKISIDYYNNRTQRWQSLNPKFEEGELFHMFRNHVKFKSESFDVICPWRYSLKVAYFR